MREGGGLDYELYGMDPWANWPYEIRDEWRAREILDLLEEAANREASSNPDIVVYEQPLNLDEGLVERLENAVQDLHNEVDGLEVRMDRANAALLTLEKLLGEHYERGDSE